MSHVAFVKKLIVDGEGKFNVLRLEAETEAELNQKRDTYLSGDYQDATEAEYQAESDARDERQGTEGGAEKAEVADEAEPEVKTAVDENAGVDAEA